MSFLLRFLSGKVIAAIVASIAVSAGGWYVSNKLDEIQTTKVKLAQEVQRSATLEKHIQSLQEQYNEQRRITEELRAKNTILNKHWDKVSAQFKEVSQSEEAKTWADTRVPKPILDSLFIPYSD